MRHRPTIQELPLSIRLKLTVSELVDILNYGSASYYAGYDAGRAIEKGHPHDEVFNEPELVNLRDVRPTG